MYRQLERKICFYNETPLMQRDYERFGFEVFLSRGFEVCFLDMTRVLHPDYLANYEPANLSDHHDVVVARDHEDVLSFIEKNRRALAVLLVSYGNQTHFLYRAFKKYDIQYAQYDSIRRPFTEEVNLFDRLHRRLEEVQKRGYGLVVKALLRRLMRAALPEVQRPAYSLRAARKYIQISPRPPKKSGIIWAHALDYDLYLKFKEQWNAKAETCHCVFLDEYFTFHPDFFTYGLSPPAMNAEKYYAGLSRFFDFVEEKTGLPVAVAAHPRARYDQRPDYFRGRRVEQFKTVELASQAKVIIAHESTAINFAVMFRKPIIFLTSDEIEKTVYGSWVRRGAAAFGKEPINVDGEIECNLEREFTVDGDRYREYFADCIKIPGTPEMPFWEIVADKIEKDYFS